ncbi:hypothetical protein BU24DRAFT_461235 [Aaosphaeria arxii CBS 175.79]|uniref:Uncharacterized protein n=1 Tax=Aaosphaeria arxii CBS 175.79 TaxID=1450172 RepID=A0A6A5Y149_9PLEO|nr:uncharacterized protein BU24DRAFT_461235 [Aaosphaeria arxii CBS 175.79]KAF2018284.1 hypothetical protein BU24DRAFT_461235 [Aaosphaeria arxii CBS 175.79]
MRINVSTDAANPAYLLGLKPEDKATIVSREWYIQSTIRYHGNITEFRFDEWEIKSSLSITSGIRATVALIAGWDYEVSANETGPALIAEFSNPTNGTQPIQVQRKATDIGHRLPSCGGHDPGKMYFMPAGLKLHFNLTLERTGDGQNNGEGVIGFKDNNALSLSTKLQRVEGCARADCSTDRTGFKRCYSQYSE